MLLLTSSKKMLCLKRMYSTNVPDGLNAFHLIFHQTNAFEVLVYNKVLLFVITNHLKARD